MNAWLDRARTESIVQVAQRLGLTIGRDGKSFGPCPGCQRSTRASEQSQKEGRRETRGACAISRGQAGREHWHCYTNGSDGCGAKGDVVTLVALVLCGRRWLRGDKEVEREVRQFFDAELAQPAPQLRQPHQAPAIESADLPRLIPAEVAEFLYSVCVPVVEVQEVANYLTLRALSPASIADRHLAFALKRGARVPDWAGCGRLAWSESGHQLILPMFGVGQDGGLIVAGVRARRTRNDEVNGKSLAPRGRSSRGLVFAAGPHWLRDAGDRRLVTIAEGEIDTLTLLLGPPARRGAVLGSTVGSACPEIAALIPRRSTVVLASHADSGGDAIAKAWRRVMPKNDLKLRRIAFERFGCAKADPGTAADRVEVLRQMAAEHGQ